MLTIKYRLANIAQPYGAGIEQAVLHLVGCPVIVTVNHAQFAARLTSQSSEPSNLIHKESIQHLIKHIIRTDTVEQFHTGL